MASISPTQTKDHVIVKRLPLGDRLAVGQQTLTLFTVVRIHVPQPRLFLFRQINIIVVLRSLVPPNVWVKMWVKSKRIN